jgi:N-methylhydantoinase B
VLRIGTQGGGGFGDPFERPAMRVAEDVVNGLVSVATAREAYGVVCDDGGAIDEAATRRLRTGHAPDSRAYAFGPAREAHELRWPQAVEDAVTRELADLPVSLGQFLGGRLRDVIERRSRTDPSDVPGLIADLRAKLGQRPTA